MQEAQYPHETRTGMQVFNKQYVMTDLHIAHEVRNWGTPGRDAPEEEGGHAWRGHMACAWNAGDTWDARGIDVSTHFYAYV